MYILEMFEVFYKINYVAIFFLSNLRNVIIYLYNNKTMDAFWLVNQLWFTVPVNLWKNHAFSELLYTLGILVEHSKNS